jgi:hypothetical protein
MKVEYQTIMYKKTHIRIRKDLVNKPKVCQGCGKTVGKEIKKLDCHHWKYEFESKEVKANPILVLKNTSWLCFRCHRIGDAIRITCEDLFKTRDLTKLMNKAIGGLL